MQPLESYAEGGVTAAVMSIPGTAVMNSNMRNARNEAVSNFNEYTNAAKPRLLESGNPVQTQRLLGNGAAKTQQLERGYATPLLTERVYTQDDVANAVKTIQDLPKGALTDAEYNGVMNAYYSYGLNPTEVNAKAVIDLAEQSIEKTGNSRNITGNMVQLKNKDFSIKRPTWRESENSVKEIYSDYKTQKSFLNGTEVKYGTKGSSRPDLYKNGSCVEVKNYNLETKQGMDRLIKILLYQINKRIIDLPKDTEQIVLIDIRGQNIKTEILRGLRDSIIRKSNIKVIIQFMR
jgi:hypothetical protein